MSNKTLTVSLTRAHNLAERMSAKLNALATEISSLTAPVRVSGFSGEAQVATFNSNANRAMELLNLHTELACAHAGLRNAVAEANAKFGVSRSLAAVEANKKTLAVLETLMEHRPDAQTVAPADLATYKPFGADAYSGVSVAPLGALPASKLDELATWKERLERENFTLRDELADLNANKVSFSLDERLVALLGLN